MSTPTPFPSLRPASLRRPSSSTTTSSTHWDPSKPLKMYLMQADNLYHQIKVYHSEGKLRNAMKIGTQFLVLVNEHVPMHQDYHQPSLSKRVSMLSEKKVEITNLLELIRPVLRKKSDAISPQSPDSSTSKSHSHRGIPTFSPTATSGVPSDHASNSAGGTASSSSDEDDEDSVPNEIQRIKSLTSSRSKEAMERWQRSLSRSPPAPPLVVTDAENEKMPSLDEAVRKVEGMKLGMTTPSTPSSAISKAGSPAGSSTKSTVTPPVPPTSTKPKVPAKPSGLHEVPVKALKKSPPGSTGINLPAMGSMASTYDNGGMKKSSQTTTSASSPLPPVHPKSEGRVYGRSPVSVNVHTDSTSSASSSDTPHTQAPYRPPKIILKAGLRATKTPSPSSPHAPHPPSMHAALFRNLQREKDAETGSVNSAMFKGASFELEEGHTTESSVGSGWMGEKGESPSGEFTARDFARYSNASGGTDSVVSPAANRMSKPTPPLSSTSSSSSPHRIPLAPTSPPIHPADFSPVNETDGHHEDNIDQFLSRFPDVEKFMGDGGTSPSSGMKKAKSFGGIDGRSPPSPSFSTQETKLPRHSASTVRSDATEGAYNTRSYAQDYTNRHNNASPNARSSQSQPSQSQKHDYSHLEVVKPTSVEEPEDEPSQTPPNDRPQQPDFVNPEVVKRWEEMKRVQEEQMRQQQQAYAQAQAQAYAQAQAQAFYQQQYYSQPQPQPTPHQYASQSQPNPSMYRSSNQENRPPTPNYQSNGYPGQTHAQFYNNSQQHSQPQHTHHQHHQNQHKHQHRSTQDTKPRARLESGEKLRWLILPTSLVPSFLAIASKNTAANLETCGILCGTLANNVLRVTTLIIPEQTSTSDSCRTDNEDDVYEYQSKRSLLTLGWIHTHPSQTCFMSSVDLHTHCSYQLMLQEAIAVVCAPKFHPNVGVFRLTDPPGLQRITKCTQNGTFHPHENDHELYRDISTSAHVVADFESKVTVVDLRRTRR